MLNRAVAVYLDEVVAQEYRKSLKCVVCFAASSILKNIDSSVEPCDDFYKFACGKFVKNTVIPDEKSTVNCFSMVTDKLQEQLRTVIEEPISPQDKKPFRLVKNLFRACMNKSE